MPLTTGTRLGPYEIIAPIGAGGMGEVYSAKDTRLDRTVALKVLPPHLADAPEVRQRFEREARAVSSLNHPNICALYDIGRQDGTDYLVMEYIEGETLAKRLERGPLAPLELSRIAIQICEALEKAHRQGVIHRDLKPGNVMLTKSGAKLLDFGLAKATAPVADRSRVVSYHESAVAGQHSKRRAHHAGHHRRHAAIHVTRTTRWRGSGRTQRYFFVRRDAVRNGDREKGLRS